MWVAVQVGSSEVIFLTFLFNFTFGFRLGIHTGMNIVRVRVIGVNRG